MEITIRRAGLLWIVWWGVVQASKDQPLPSASAPRTEYELDSNFHITSDKQTRRYELVIHNTTASPDGFWRPILAINNQMPGPLIEANEGDRLEITVVNNIDSPLTMHWHGLFQNGTNWEDGPSGITQCPIAPGVTYTYKFSLDGQYGTFWYHAHYESLRVEGVAGPLIIHSPQDPLKRGVDFHQDIVLFYTDWYHTLASVITPQMLTNQGYRSVPAAPSANSAIVNGVGTWDCRFATTNQRCEQNSPPEFTVVAGSKIRFRLVNAGAHAMLFFSADNHTLNVTEADFTPVHGPTGIHRVPIHNAQRYSVIVDIPSNEAGSDFWIRALMDTDCWPWVTNDIQDTAYAIVRVIAPGGQQLQKPSNQRPTTANWADLPANECMDLDPNSLVPMIAKRVPTTVLGSGTLSNAVGFKVLSPQTTSPSLPAQTGNSHTNRRQLELEPTRMAPALGANLTSPGMVNNTQVNAPPGTGARFFMNNISSTILPQQPILHDLTPGGSGMVNSSNMASVVYPSLGWYDLYLVNTDAGTNHPFHLHGPEMHLVAFGQGLPTPENLRNLAYQTENPLRRDTVLIERGSFVVVRLNTDLPGVWLLHCHIDWHLSAGFAGVVVVQPKVISTWQIPAENEALCLQQPTNPHYRSWR